MTKKNKEIKLYSHQTTGGAKYLMDTYNEWEHNGKSGREGTVNTKTKYLIRLDHDRDGTPILILK